jgi:hypothetical protein
MRFPRPNTDRSGYYVRANAAMPDAAGHAQIATYAFRVLISRYCSGIRIDQIRYYTRFNGVRLSCAQRGSGISWLYWPDSA